MSFFQRLLNWFRGRKPIASPSASPSAPPAPEIAIFTVKVTPNVPAVVRVGTKEWSTRPDGTIVEEFQAGTLHQVFVKAEGYVTSPALIVMMAPGWMPVHEVTLVPVPVTGRKGPVLLSGSSLVDDAGPWNALGTTLFWALWGEKNDPDKLEKNLKWASSRYDYIRILGMVGSTSWSDRVIDPKASDYWTTVDALCARCKRHGLRIQITVFADAQAMMPNAGERQVFAAAWGAKVQRDPERFILAETANEYWQNGIESTDELRTLTRIIADQTSVLVAASAPSLGSYPEVDDTPEQKAAIAEWMAIYGSGAADIMTHHFDRDVTRDCGWWRPVRQPWEMQFGAFNTGVKAYVNNEPIGPESSGTADDDPARLVMAAVVTWLTRGAAYTLHSGAGIRGGGEADLKKGRSANLWEVKNIDVTTTALAKVRKLLPPIVGGSPKNGHWPDAPLTVSNLDAVCRAYQTVLPNNTFVATLIGVKSPVTATPKRPANVRAYRWTGEEISMAGPFTDATIFIGQWI